MDQLDLFTRKVRCINNLSWRELYLTEGKIYEVVDHDPVWGYITGVNDDGYTSQYYEHRFELAP